MESAVFTKAAFERCGDRLFLNQLSKEEQSAIADEAVLVQIECCETPIGLLLRSESMHDSIMEAQICRKRNEAVKWINLGSDFTSACIDLLMPCAESYHVLSFRIAAAC